VSPRRPRGPQPRRTRPEAAPGSPWPVRIIAIVAAVVVITGVVVAAAQGVLFTAPTGP
jgi:hypothetical protein